MVVVPVLEDNEERSSAEDLSLLAEEVKQIKEEEEEEEGLGEDVEDEITYLMEDATSPIDAESEVEVETEEVSFSESEGLTDCAADTPPICPDRATTASTAFTFPSTDPSHLVHTVHSSSADECSSESVLTDTSRGTGVEVDLNERTPVQTSQSDRIIMTKESDIRTTSLNVENATLKMESTGCEEQSTGGVDAIIDQSLVTDDMKNKITFKIENEMKTETRMETKDENKTSLNEDVNKIEKNTKQSVPREVNQFQQIMDPNEPVFMGSKKYGKLFVFWQVE